MGIKRFFRSTPLDFSTRISFSEESLPRTTMMERRKAMGNVNVR